MLMKWTWILTTINKNFVKQEKKNAKSVCLKASQNNEQNTRTFKRKAKIRRRKRGMFCRYKVFHTWLNDGHALSYSFAWLRGWQVDSKRQTQSWKGVQIYGSTCESKKRIKRQKTWTTTIELLPDKDNKNKEKGTKTEGQRTLREKRWKSLRYLISNLDH